MRKRLEKWLRSWLEGWNFAGWLAGTAVRDAIHKGDTTRFSTTCSVICTAGSARTPPFARCGRCWRRRSQATSERSARSSDGSLTFLEWAALDKEKAVGAIVGEIANYVRVVQQDRSHTLRKNLQERIVAYATKLATGDQTVLRDSKAPQAVARREAGAGSGATSDVGCGYSESELKSTDRAGGFVDFEAIARSAGRRRGRTGRSPERTRSISSAPGWTARSAPMPLGSQRKTRRRRRPAKYLAREPSSATDRESSRTAKARASHRQKSSLKSFCAARADAT